LVLGVDSIGHNHLPDTFNGKAVLELLPVDPQQFAERVGVAAVGLDFRLLLGLDEDDLAEVISQRDSELLCVLVDSQVQHGFGSPGGTK